MKKTTSIILIILLISTTLVSCGKSKIDKLTDWMNRLTGSVAELLRQNIGEPLPTAISNDWANVINPLGEEKYPYDPAKKMKDVVNMTITQKGNGPIEMIFWVPVGKEDNKRAEELTGKHSDRYFVVGVVQMYPDPYNNLEKVKTKVYISPVEPGKEVKTMQVVAPWPNGGQIPIEYTCDGINRSPRLKIANLPEGTKSLAIIVSDPDAPMGTFIHWVAWNITPTDTIPSGIPKQAMVSVGKFRMMQGINDFGRVGYDGPCPPKGHGIHHYHFKVYALNAELDLKGNITADILKKYIDKHKLAETEVVGIYSR